MLTFVMLTRLNETMTSPRALEKIERLAMNHVRKECPNVEWVASYALFGAYDYVDVFNAHDLDTAMKVAALVRCFGHAHTELLPAKPWEEFKEMIRHLPGPDGLILDERNTH